MAPLLPVLGFLGSAAAVSLSGSYAPVNIPCTANATYVRPASEGLSAAEKNWYAKRQPQVVEALELYLNRANISGFDVSSYISKLRANASATPKLGMTFSGGGQRARTIGLGMYNAFDGRNEAANAAGVGGLSQALSYVSGLSGGSQTIVTLAMSDFSPATEILARGNLVDPNATQVNNSIYNDLGAKWSLGFNETFADIFAATQFANLIKNGSADIDPFSRLFSDVRDLPAFANGSTPLPFLMFNEVLPPGVPGSLNFQGYLYPAFNSSTTNTTNYEASPFEWGAWQRAEAFTDLSYLSTIFSAGQPVNTSQCVQGFDSAAYMSGAALQAANLWVVQVATNGTQGQFDKKRRHLVDLEKRQQDPNAAQGYGPSYPPNEAVIEQQRTANGTVGFVDQIPDIVQIPFFNNRTAQQLTYAEINNPFRNFNASESTLQGQDVVLLQDGSETGQINPVWPLIQEQRRADFLIVSDNSGTELSSGWMNGTNLQTSYYQAKQQLGPNAFPKIPTATTTAYSNVTPILDSSLTSRQINLLWDNTLHNAAQTNGTDKAWPGCIACGAIYRSLQRLNQTIPDACQTCMKSYCWNGQESTELARFVSPPLFNNPSLSFAEWNRTIWSENK